MRFADFRRTLFTIHMWVGLILGVLLAALGLSGSILVYDDKIADLIAPAPKAVTAGDPLPLTMLANIARRTAHERGAHGQLQILMPDREGDAVTVRVGQISVMGNGSASGQRPEGGERRRREGGRGPGGGEGPGRPLQIYLDPVSGAVLGVRQSAQPWLLTFSHQLHGNFLMGRDGRSWVVGPLGVAMLILGVTGLVLWWPRRGQWKYAFFVRRTATGLRFHRELHAATGIWIFVVFMVVSFSGVVIAWPQTFGLFPPGFNPRAAATVAPQDGPRIGATEAVIAAGKALPGGVLRGITIPARPDQAISVTYLMHDAINASVIVNPYSGQVISVRDPSQSFMAWQRPVHQGSLGPIWRFLVFLSGLVPLLFVITGVIMWAKKRQRRLPMTVLTDDATAGEVA